jgi:hypothetical protein
MRPSTQTPGAGNGPGVLLLRSGRAQMQDAGKIAGEFQVDTLGSVARRHRDPADHGSDQVHRLAAELGIEQQLLELGHTAAVELREVGVDHDRRRALEGVLGGDRRHG